MPIKNLDKISSQKILLYVLLFVVVTLSAYWLKSNMGIDFFEKYTLSEIFPFNYLVPNKVIGNQSPGILLDDSFDSFSLFGNWTSLWMREKGKVTKEIVDTVRDNSHCLVIKSRSSESWSLSHKNIIKVKQGEVFTFQVAVKLNGDNVLAQIGLALFDKDISVVSSNRATNSTIVNDRWILLKNKFTIPDEIFYIRLKISGTGEGEFQFDDVYFQCALAQEG